MRSRSLSGPTPRPNSPGVLNEGATLTAAQQKSSEPVGGTLCRLEVRRGWVGVGTTRLLEESISAELVLVDRELARRARTALPDPPWLLPVLAELQQADGAAPAELGEKPSPRARPRVAKRPRDRSVPGHIAATFAFGCVLLVFVVLVATAADLLYGSDGLTFSTTSVPQVAPPRPNKSSVDAQASRKAKGSEPRVKRPAKRSEPQVSQTPKASPTAGSSARRVSPQRVFSWHRRAAAIYYQVYLFRGPRTIYQARTLKLGIALPARLKLEPGTYHVVVRPAVPSDAGIILGDAIIAKTIRV